MQLGLRVQPNCRPDAAGPVPQRCGRVAGAGWAHTQAVQPSLPSRLCSRACLSPPLTYVPSPLFLPARLGTFNAPSFPASAATFRAAVAAEACEALGLQPRWVCRPVSQSHAWMCVLADTLAQVCHKCAVDVASQTLHVLRTLRAAPPFQLGGRSRSACGSAMMWRAAIALLLALGAAGPCWAGLDTQTVVAEFFEVTSLWETGYCGSLMQVVRLRCSRAATATGSSWGGCRRRRPP